MSLTAHIRIIPKHRDTICHFGDQIKKSFIFFEKNNPDNKNHAFVTLIIRIMSLIIL